MVTELLWYSPKVFGTAWAVLTGKNLEPAKQWIIGGVIGHLAIALVLAVIVNLANASTAVDGLIVGILVWIGFIVTLEIGELIWEKIPIKLFLFELESICLPLDLPESFWPSGDRVIYYAMLIWTDSGRHQM